MLALTTLLPLVYSLAAPHSVFGFHVKELGPSLSIENCLIIGKPYNSSGAYFYSIPYTHPPIGSLRWENSILISNYSNTSNVCNDKLTHNTVSNQQQPQTTNFINATYHRSRCFQPIGPIPANMSSKYPPESEDCVHLDIYSPNFSILNNSNNSKPLGVIVYFHGGSSISGCNCQYDFTNFSIEMNAIIVVPNYRLATLGFLTFNE